MASFGELLGKEIFKKRTAREWSQKAVVSKAFGNGVDGKQIRRYEAGESANPNPKAYMPICKVLGISQERIFELIKISDNKHLIDVTHFEFGDISPDILAKRVRMGVSIEHSVSCIQNLSHLIVYNKSVSAMTELEKLMADASLSLLLLDHCFFFYHFSFRKKIDFALHQRAVEYLESLLWSDRFDISDKAAFSLGELFLYNPYQEIKDTAQGILLGLDTYSPHVRDLLSYTQRRVGLK